MYEVLLAYESCYPGLMGAVSAKAIQSGRVEDILAGDFFLFCGFGPFMNIDHTTIMMVQTMAMVVAVLVPACAVAEAFIAHHSSPFTTLLSSSKTSSASIKRIMVPSSMDISILQPIGNGTFGGVYHARDEKSGENEEHRGSRNKGAARSYSHLTLR